MPNPPLRFVRAREYLAARGPKPLTEADLAEAMARLRALSWTGKTLRPAGLPSFVNMKSRVAEDE